MRALTQALTNASAFGNEHDTIESYTGAQIDLGWGDIITITSNLYFQNALVPFERRLVLDRILNAGGTDCSAYVYADMYLGSLSIFDSTNDLSNILWKSEVVYLPVGEQIPISGRLSVGTTARSYANIFPYAYPSDSDFATADASHTANYYLIPLIDSVSYTSASGRTYFYSSSATPVLTPALLPDLIGLGLMPLQAKMG
ncbi:hypothetical protein HC928_24710 [bacterium]|nr:hypothetical protein [bacterium]